MEAGRLVGSHRCESSLAAHQPLSDTQGAPTPVRSRLDPPVPNHLCTAHSTPALAIEGLTRSRHCCTYVQKHRSTVRRESAHVTTDASPSALRLGRDGPWGAVDPGWLALAFPLGGA